MDYKLQFENGPNFYIGLYTRRDSSSRLLIYLEILKPRIMLIYLIRTRLISCSFSKQLFCLEHYTIIRSYYKTLLNELI